MTLAEARKHFGPKLESLRNNGAYQKALQTAAAVMDAKAVVGLSKSRMNKTEAEYDRILEAKWRRGEVQEHCFEGMSLSWGRDPETGKPMWYTPDFVVWPTGGTLELHEVKGGHIFSRDLVRFKGCRAEWGKHYRFVMMQKKAGAWSRIY